jgi:hypothetical protein
MSEVTGTIANIEDAIKFIQERASVNDKGVMTLKRADTRAFFGQAGIPMKALEQMHNANDLLAKGAVEVVTRATESRIADAKKAGTDLNETPFTTVMKVDVEDGRMVVSQISTKLRKDNITGNEIRSYGRTKLDMRTSRLFSKADRTAISDRIKAAMGG